MEKQIVKLSELTKKLDIWFGEDKVISRGMAEAAIIDALVSYKIYVKDDIHICETCKYKEPLESKKFCALEDDDGSAACFRGDNWMSKQ